MVTSLSPPGRRAAELKGSIQFPHPQPTRADRLTVALVALDRDMCSLESQNTLPLSCIHEHTCTRTQSYAHIHQVITIFGPSYRSAFHAFMNCIRSLRYPHSKHALFDVCPHMLTTPYCVFTTGIFWSMLMFFYKQRAVKKLHDCWWQSSNRSIFFIPPPLYLLFKNPTLHSDIICTVILWSVKKLTPLSVCLGDKRIKWDG